jgi:hypothetical protein
MLVELFVLKPHYLMVYVKIPQACSYIKVSLIQKSDRKRYIIMAGMD